MMKIKVSNPAKQGKVNEINLTLATAIDSEYIVGRSPQSGLILDSSDVSRQHGKFFLQNEDYYYSDLGSANGSLINDKLAKTNQSYLLKSGDVIRIGEFVLIMEAISEETEALPATVLNSDWQSFAKLDAPEEVAAQTQEPVSEVPELVTNESEPLTPAPEELSQGSKVASVHASEEAEAEVMAQTSEAASEVYEPEKTSIQEMTYVQAPEEFEQAVIAEATMQTPEELEESSEEEEVESSPVASATALEAVSPPAEPVASAPEAATMSEDITQTSEEEEKEEFEAEIVVVAEAMMQAPEEEEEEEFEAEIVVVAEVTTIQTSEELEAVPEKEAESARLTTEIALEPVTPALEAVAVPENSTQTPEEEEEEEFEAAVLAKATTIQVPEELEAVLEEEELESSPVPSVTAPETVSPSAESGTLAPEAATVSEDITQTSEEEEEEELEEEEFEAAVLAKATTIQVPEELEAVLEEEELESSPVPSMTVPEVVIPPSEPVTPASAAAVSEDVTQTPEEEEEEVMTQTPETTSKAFEIISKKYIALMAHDTKKPELVQFVNQHKAFLSKCLTIATPSISETLYQQTDLAISTKTPLVPTGGYQAIASLVGTGEILAVVLLRDFMVTQSSQANEEALLRLCNINQVLVANNMSTAEAIMHYVKDMVTSL